MTRKEIIDGLEIYTAGRLNKDRVHITVKELQKFIDEIKDMEQEPCEDCISRQDLDKALYECFHEEDNLNNITDVRLGAVRNFIKNFPSVTPQPKWISVSEKLPKSSGVYIVSRWFSDGEESAILIDANYYDGCGEWYDDNRINWGRDLVTDKIVAWMPLPKPYKAESEVKL